MFWKNHHTLLDKHKWTIDPTSLEIIPKSDFHLRSLQVMRSNIRYLKHTPGKEALDRKWNQFNNEWLTGMNKVCNKRYKNKMNSCLFVPVENTRPMSLSRWSRNLDSPYLQWSLWCESWEHCFHWQLLI